MAHKNFEEETRKPNLGKDTDSLSNDDLQTGCMLRIANAAEVMAKNHNQLIADHDWYKKRCEELMQQNQKLYRRIYALQAWVTRWRKKAKSI